MKVFIVSIDIRSECRDPEVVFSTQEAAIKYVKSRGVDQLDRTYQTAHIAALEVDSGEPSTLDEIWDLDNEEDPAEMLCQD